MKILVLGAYGLIGHGVSGECRRLSAVLAKTFCKSPRIKSGQARTLCSGNCYQRRFGPLSISPIAITAPAPICQGVGLRRCEWRTRSMQLDLPSS